MQCNSCLSLFIDESRGTFEIAEGKDISDYFKNLNRGGLTYSSKALVSVYQAAYGIFNICISAKFEKVFMSLKNQKQILFELISEFLDLSDNFGFDSICMSCKKQKKECFIMCLRFLLNILLNNYTKSRNNKVKYLTALNKQMAKF